MFLDLFGIITIISLVVSLVCIVLLVMAYRVRAKPNTEVPSVSVDVEAIVQEFSERMRRLETMLIDQKVRMEILDIRAYKQVRENSLQKYEDVSVSHRNTEDSGQVKAEEGGAFGKAYEGPRKVNTSVVGLNGKEQGTEKQALKIVSESRIGVTAKFVQERIGRSREHTARMMNYLYREGLVSRSNDRPFRYSLTEKARRALEAC